MLFHFSFKQMDSSAALQSYAEDKIREKVKRFVTKPNDAIVTFSVQRHQMTAHLSLRAGDGFSIEVEQSSPDMYMTVDQLVEKLGKQLRRHKEKLKDHKLPKTITYLDQVDMGLPSVQVDSEVVDASDIVKYEEARRRANAR